MMRAIDSNNVEVDAEILEGPCVVNTPDGEFCASPGHVLVRYDGQKPMVLTQELFDAQFTEV